MQAPDPLADVRPSRAAVHLRRLAEAAPRCGDLTALLAVGELLEGPDDITRSEVLAVLDRPARRVTWGSVPLDVLAWQREERLDDLPLTWWYRSSERAPDNHTLFRPLLFWSRAHGLDEHALTAVAAGGEERLDALRPKAPEVTELVARLRAERAEAASALTDVVDTYWERAWRRNQQRLDRYPEHRLWDLAWGLVDLEHALEQLREGT